jgi:ankyrin repeat protein
MADPELYIAVRDNEVEFVREFLRCNHVDLEETGGTPQQLHNFTPQYYTALELAVKVRRDPAMVKLLVEYGADKDRLYNEETLLHHVINIQNLSIARILLMYGANKEIKDYRGSTPLNLAVNLGNFQIATWLLECGANVNTTETENGYTPLIWAAFDGREEMLHLVCEFGADLSIRDTRSDLKAEEWATLRGYHHIAQILIQMRHRRTNQHVG